jgi:hypothetical protein
MLLSRFDILPRLLISLGFLTLMIAALSGFAVFRQSNLDLFENLVRRESNEILDQRVEKDVYEGRMRIWLALSTGDPDHWQKSEAAFQIAREMLAERIAHTKDPARLARATEVKETIAAYEAKAARLRDFKGINAALDTAEGRQAVTDALTADSKIESIAEPLGDDFDKAATAKSAETLGRIAKLINAALVLGIFCMLLGIALAVVIAEYEAARERR